MTNRSTFCTLALTALTLVGCGASDSQQQSKSTSPEESFETPTPRQPAPDESSESADEPVAARTPSEPDPETTDPVGAALADLASEDPADRSAAVTALLTSNVDEERRADVAEALIPRLADADDDVRNRAVAALQKWGRPEDFEPVVQLLARPEEPVRHAAMRALLAMKNPVAAEEVAARLQSAFDRRVATRVLTEFGPVAEDAVLQYVEDGDAEVRLAVVKILAVIGKSQESREALVEFQMDPDPRVAQAAARAL